MTAYMPWRKPKENYRSMYRHFPEILHFQKEVQEKEWERKRASPTLRQRRHSQSLPGVECLQDDKQMNGKTLHFPTFGSFLHRNCCCGTVTMPVESSFSPRIDWNNQGPVLPARAPRGSWLGTSALAKFSRMMPVSKLIHTVWAVQLYDSWLSWRGWGCPQWSNETCELNWFSVHLLLLFKTYIYIYIHTQTLGNAFHYPSREHFD